MGPAVPQLNQQNVTCGPAICQLDVTTDPLTDQTVRSSCYTIHSVRAKHSIV